MPYYLVVTGFETKLKSKTKKKTHPIEKKRFPLPNIGREMGYNIKNKPYSLTLNLGHC